MFAALLAYLFFVLIRPQDYPALVETLAFPFQPVALIIAAAIWMLSPRKNFDAPQYLVLAAFFVVLMVSHIFNGWLGGAIEQLNKFAPVVLAFVVFANALDRRERILTVMGMFCICASVMSIHGIEQVHTGNSWTGVELSQGSRIMYVGIFNDPNDMGMFFVTCEPMAAYLASQARGLRRWFWWLILGILLYGVYLTTSRGALLGTLVVMGVYIWQRRGAFIAGGLGAMAMAVVLALPSRMSEMDVEEESAQGRVDSWYEGIQMFIGHPVFGVGPDMYSDYHHLTAHNSFVLVMAETGIIGFTLWLAFIGYGFRMMWAGSRGFDEPTESIAENLLATAPEDYEPPQPGAGDGEAGRDGAAAYPGLESDLSDPAVREEAAWEAAFAHAQAIHDARMLALTLFLSLVGFFTTAFFLSRSYVVTLYLLAAVVVAHYVDMRREDPGLPHFTLSSDLLLWPAIGVGGVVALFIVVKVLLVMS